MTTFTWPSTRAWQASSFEMRVIPNTTSFTSPYTKSTQVIDYMGERWQIKADLSAGNDPILGAAIEAFFDRLRGPVNLIAMWNQRRPLPQGTLRDGVSGSAQWKTASATNATWQTSAPAAATWGYIGPVLYAAGQLDGSIVISTTPGKTLFAGDHVGCGQLFRAMADATADAAGKLTVEVLPRVRAAIPISSAVVCTRPTANFMLKADGVPVTWRAGMFDGSSFELIETY